MCFISRNIKNQNPREATQIKISVVHVVFGSRAGDLTKTPFLFFFRVSDLQGSIDATMGAFDVIGKARTHLDDATISMQWEVLGWPQKVRRVGSKVPHLHNMGVKIFLCRH